MNIELSEEFETAIRGLSEIDKIGIVFAHILVQVYPKEALSKISGVLVKYLTESGFDKRKAEYMLDMFMDGTSKTIKLHYNEQTGNRIVLPGEKN